MSFPSSVGFEVARLLVPSFVTSWSAGPLENLPSYDEFRADAVVNEME